MRNGLFIGLASYNIIAKKSGEGKQTTYKSKIEVGGPAAVASMTFSELGGDARFATKLKGPLKDFVVGSIEDSGVSVEVKGKDKILVKVTIIDKGKRKVLNEASTRIFLDDKPPLDLVDVDIVEVDGYHPDLAYNTLKKADELGIPVVFGGDALHPGMNRLFRHVDIAIVPNDFVKDPFWLHDQGVKCVIVTDGSNDLICSFGKKKEMIEVPKKDSFETGAFHGAFCHYLEGFDEESIINAIKSSV